MNNILNLSQEPAKIAEDAKNLFNKHIAGTNSKGVNGFLLTEHYVNQFSINLIENMLSTTDKFITTYRARGSSAYYLAPNPNWSVLTDVFEILKKEVK